MAKTVYELQRRRDLLCERIAANLDILIGSVSTKGPTRPGYNLTFKLDGVTRSRHIRKEDLEKVRLMTSRQPLIILILSKPRAASLAKETISV